MNDLSKKIVNDAVELAKVNAVNVLKGLKFDDIKTLVEAEMASIIKPLEDETKTTTSYWVKIRNRIYITVLNNSVNSIVNSIQKKIRELQLQALAQQPGLFFLSSLCYHECNMKLCCSLQGVRKCIFQNLFQKALL